MRRVMCSLLLCLVLLSSRAPRPAAQARPGDVDVMDVLMNVVSGGAYRPPDPEDPPPVVPPQVPPTDAESLSHDATFADMPKEPPQKDPPPPEPLSGDATFAGASKDVPQDEDVVPISGDSHGDVEEVMLDTPGPHLISYVRPAPRPAAAVTPVAVFSGLRAGAMQMRVFSPRGLTAAERARLSRTPLVIRPLVAAEQSRVQRWIASVTAPGSGMHVTGIAVRAYCVEARKKAPTSAALFVVAPAAEQAQFAPAATVRVMAETAASHGFLRTQGDAAEYGRFITQYAIWTSIEHWDQARFTDEFISRTKQEYAAAKKRWTRETEQTLRVLAPARWRDVQLAIGAARKFDSSRRISGRGDRTSATSPGVDR
jgi:hypothetical protein